jgi:hypothetical protein
MSHCPENVPSRARGKTKLWIWAAFGMVLLLYVLSVVRAKPVANFGVFVDDGLYFSSGKALAAGQGYILPDFPSHLPSIKYPELYPLLLAGVWKLDSQLSENVPLALGTTVIFGCLALLVTFLMLRRWPVLGDWPALAIVFLVSSFGTFLNRSAVIGSDIPFMAFLLGGTWLVERSLEREPGTMDAAGAGLLVGMAVGLRSMGIPAAAGIGLLLLCKRKFRRLFSFCLTGLPLTLLWSWPAVSAILGISQPAVTRDATRSGWTQTVCYYSSYACAWKMHLPDSVTIWKTILLNLQLIAAEPGVYLLHPLALQSVTMFAILVLLLGAAAYVGIVRQVYREGWRPLHAILPLYLLTIVAYPYSPDRFLLPFAPLFFVGIWLEGQRLAGFLAGPLTRAGNKSERLAAGILVLGGLAVVTSVAVNLLYSLPKKIEAKAREHEAILSDEQGAFAWLRQHAAPNAAIVALEDGLTYLHTGRKAILPIACVSKTYYLTDPRYIHHDIAHLADVARHIHASFWLSTPYDYPLQPPAEQALLLRKQEKLLAAAPVVYRSMDRRVVLYDTRCLWRAKGDGCAPPHAGQKAGP